MRISRLFTVALLGALWAASVPVSAAEPTCTDLKPFADELASLQEKSRAGLESVRAELALRKRILTATLACSTSDARMLEESIAKLELTDPNLQPVRERELQNVREAIAFYESKNAAVSTQGIRGTQDIARNVADWRASNYLPLKARVEGLILWTKNQEFFSSAEKRLTQIQKTVSRLQLNENKEVVDLLSQAEEDLSSATKLNASIHAGFLSGSDTDANLDRIKESLSALSQTYAHFFEIRDIVQKIVP